MLKHIIEKSKNTVSNTYLSYEEAKVIGNELIKYSKELEEKNKK